jgi:hypothetical protein
LDTRRLKATSHFNSTTHQFEEATHSANGSLSAALVAGLQTPMANFSAAPMVKAATVSIVALLGGSCEWFVMLDHHRVTHMGLSMVGRQSITFCQMKRGGGDQA